MSAESDRTSLFPKQKQTTVGIHPAIGGLLVRFPVRPSLSFVSLFKTIQLPFLLVLVKHQQVDGAKLQPGFCQTVKDSCSYNSVVFHHECVNVTVEISI